MGKLLKGSACSAVAVSLMLVAAAPLGIVDRANAQQVVPAAGSAPAQPYQRRGKLVLKLGDFDVYSVIDAQGSYPYRTPAGKTAAEVERHRHNLTPDGMQEGVTGSFLILNKTNKRVVLVEAGIGPNTPPNSASPGARPEPTLLQDLAAAGYKPEDVTDVLFTHLHLDHVGWASVDGKPTFPNATYRAHQADWDYWVENPPAYPDDPRWAWQTKTAVEVLRPIRAQMKTYLGKSVEIYPGLTMRWEPGHTPGSSIIVLKSGGKTAWILGDAIHSTMELEDRTLLGDYDVDAKKALERRNILIDERLRDDPVVAASHLMGLRFGHLVDTPKNGLQYYFTED